MFVSLLAMNEISLDQLSAQRFAERVRTKFQVLVEQGASVPLELTAVTTPILSDPENVSADRPKVECFSLLFDGPMDRPLAQRMYRFMHEGLGAFDLFIVPVGAEHQARQYEAVFHRVCSP
jgi:hypothetical protein